MRGYLEDLKAGGRPMTDKELADHYKHLYSEVKKQKDDVVELIKKQDKIRNYYEYEECGYDEYNYDDDFKEELLKILEVEKNE